MNTKKSSILSNFSPSITAAVCGVAWASTVACGTAWAFAAVCGASLGVSFSTRPRANLANAREGAGNNSAVASRKMWPRPGTPPRTAWLTNDTAATWGTAPITTQRFMLMTGAATCGGIDPSVAALAALHPSTQIRRRCYSRAHPATFNQSVWLEQISY